MTLFEFQFDRIGPNGFFGNITKWKKNVENMFEMYG